mmetsp:Transcript_18157/g.61205  ORF Transcript_18157/g.61205 Transcript_18157/m.61205 type:complete len:219 (-) Transcript_18157:2416-3072(-)
MRLGSEVETRADHSPRALDLRVGQVHRVVVELEVKARIQVAADAARRLQVEADFIEQRARDAPRRVPPQIRRASEFQRGHRARERLRVPDEVLEPRVRGGDGEDARVVAGVEADLVEDFGDLAQVEDRPLALFGLSPKLLAHVAPRLEPDPKCLAHVQRPVRVDGLALQGLDETVDEFKELLQRMPRVPQLVQRRQHRLWAVGRDEPCKPRALVLVAC